MAKDKYGIIPPTGAKGKDWPQYSVLPQGLEGSLSMGGWTSGNEGFVQQTFLGASIRSFNVSAGFGDTSTTMGIELVNDEYNVSDKLGLGLGDDTYHDGESDHFLPPVVGAPVFFKFGKNHATVEQAFRKTIDDLYDIDTLKVPAYDVAFPEKRTALPITEQPEYHYLVSKTADEAVWIDRSALYDPAKADTVWRGSGHFAFGGILQSYTENRSSAGNPLYSVKLTDPREILTNTELLLNNYQGTTFNNKNLYNIYGFLEYDPSDSLLEELESKANKKDVLTKFVSDIGKATFDGEDIYQFGEDKQYDDGTIGTDPVETEIVSRGEAIGISGEFPITGQGFSRRSENGIPWYRVEQAMNALFKFDQFLPQEYVDAGFGGMIDFRGYNYVVDWGGIPTHEIPNTYYLNFDKMSMMDLALELCDVLSRDLYVSLLPVIDHPSMAGMFRTNQYVLDLARDLAISQKDEDGEDVKDDDGNVIVDVEATDAQRRKLLGDALICGVIRIDTIDRKTQPKYGTVKKYLDELESKGIYVENRDIGFEVSNVTTDKFVAGAQEVEMYYFNGLRDRDNYFERLTEQGDEKAVGRAQHMAHDKWMLDTNLKQQILPFYGFLGDNAVTIPRGFGSWQQILLDARNLDAIGVGAYYVATEMELRAASISYNSWKDFLLNYNEIYMEEISENKGFMGAFVNNVTEEIEGLTDQISEEEGSLKDQLNKLKNRDFAVTVPRCVWNSDKSPPRTHELQVDPETDEPITDDDGFEVFEGKGGPFEGKMGKIPVDKDTEEDGYPASPCSPPYGYPLYYKRASAIGIPEAGIIKIGRAQISLLSNIKELEDKKREARKKFNIDKHNKARVAIGELQPLIRDLKKRLEKVEKGGDAAAEAALKSKIKVLQDRIKDIKANLKADREGLKKLEKNTKAEIVEIKKTLQSTERLRINLSSNSRKAFKNAKKVYEFVKKTADDNLGKKFLVKIPKACNINYSDTIKHYGTTKGELEDQDEERGVQPENYYAPVNNAWDVEKGPFGFEPQPISSIPDYKGSEEFQKVLGVLWSPVHSIERSNHAHFTETNTRKGDNRSREWTTMGKEEHHHPDGMTTFRSKSGAHWHYLDRDAFRNVTQGVSPFAGHPLEDKFGHSFRDGYTYGALKCNFNPMSEKWEYNYMPEPQGGFFNYALYDENLKHTELKTIKNPDYVSPEDTPDQPEFLKVSPAKLPAITRSILAPKLMDKITGKNGRIKCYVRYDHSQDLDLSKIDSKSVEQQSIEKDNTIVPDAIQTLPNQNPDKKAALDQIETRLRENSLLDRQAPSVAFVTCDISEQFYMAPQVVDYNTKVWAEDYSIKLAEQRYRMFWIEDERETLDDPDSDDPDDTIPNPNFGCQIPTPVVERMQPLFGVPKGGGILTKTQPVVDDEGNETDEEEEVDDVHYVVWDDFERYWSDTYKGWIIRTEEKDLDPEHVYALITIPGKIAPTIDKRYVDGPLKALEADRIGHAMTEDVVKIDEFGKPAPIDNEDTVIDCSQPGINWSFQDLVAAEEAHKQITKGINLSMSNLSYKAPSPIYPDMVALPLLSMERCYGPWLSSALDGIGVLNEDIKYSDIGGKIEFIKDEKLAPWNYAGYQLMNDAGKLQTKFSNSLLLFSERGAFAYAEAPTGIALARGLQDRGPLVTSISVNVSANQIGTSVQLDLYTARFGKLQKQKEIAISQISRERQKIIDKNNLLERRGIAMGQRAAGHLSSQDTLAGQKLIDAARESNEFIDTLSKPSIITVSATNEAETHDTVDPSMAIPPQPSVRVTREGTEGAIQTPEQLAEIQSIYQDGQQLADAYNRTAGASIDTLFKGVSDAPDDPYFASRRMDDAIRNTRNSRNMS